MVVYTKTLIDALANRGIEDERDTIIGKYTIENISEADIVNATDLPIPRYGVMNVDWSEGVIQCHVCNGFFVDLHSHLRAHGLGAAEYRKVYGINDKLPLDFERLESTGNDVKRSGWRKLGVTVVDEEFGVKAYNEPEHDAADSGGGEEVSADMGY